MPLARRVPKRGFNNIFAKPLEIVNLSALNAFDDGATVTAEALLERGILSKCTYGYKVLRKWKTDKENHSGGFRILQVRSGCDRGGGRKGGGEVA